MVKDVYNVKERYSRALERLENNEDLPKVNRKLSLEWLSQKEEKFKGNLSKDEIETEKIRYFKTLLKYCNFLTNISYWFEDLSKITEKQLQDFKDKFQKGELYSYSGKEVKTLNEYLNKLIKSDFFKWLGYENIVKKVFDSKTKNKESDVQFIDYDDFLELINHCNTNEQKAVFYVLYSTGIRVGTLLNLKVSDFERKYNPKTKVYYFLLHIKKDYSKSNNVSTIPILLNESNIFLEKYLNKKKKEDYFINYSYSGIRQIVINVSERAKVRTKPLNNKLHIHILRKSCAIYLLNNGYSSDQVKSILGHKPSSLVIDSYVNYLGLNFEKETTKIQTDSLIDLKNQLQENQRIMTIQQQETDKLREFFNKEKSEKEFIKLKLENQENQLDKLTKLVNNFVNILSKEDKHYTTYWKDIHKMQENQVTIREEKEILQNKLKGVINGKRTKKSTKRNASNK